MKDWERFWAGYEGDPRRRPRPPDPSSVDERPALSGWQYLVVGDTRGLIVMTVPGLGSVLISVAEHVDNPEGRLEPLTLSLSA